MSGINRRVSLLLFSFLSLIAPSPEAAAAPGEGAGVGEDLHWLASARSVSQSDWASIMRRRRGDPLFTQQALVFWPAMMFEANKGVGPHLPEFVKVIDLVFITAPQELGVGEVILRLQGEAGRIAGAATFLTAGFEARAALQPFASVSSASFTYPANPSEVFSIEVNLASGERISLQGAVPALPGRGADASSPIAGARCGGLAYRQTKVTHDLETVVLAPGGLRPVWSSSQSKGSVPAEVARGNQIVEQCTERFRSGGFGLVLIRPELNERVAR